MNTHLVVMITSLLSLVIGALLVLISMALYEAIRSRRKEDEKIVHKIFNIEQVNDFSGVDEE